MQISSARAWGNVMESESKLRDYRWQYRVVLTQVDSQSAAEEMQQALQVKWQEYEERKLAVFVIIENKTILRISDKGLKSQPLDIEEVNTRMKSRHTLLIGLDGGSKSVYDSFDPRQIFADIDAMPMRRAQLR